MEIQSAAMSRMPHLRALAGVGARSSFEYSEWTSWTSSWTSPPTRISSGGPEAGEGFAVPVIAGKVREWGGRRASPLAQARQGAHGGGHGSHSFATVPP